MCLPFCSCSRDCVQPRLILYKSLDRKSCSAVIPNAVHGCRCSIITSCTWQIPLQYITETAQGHEYPDFLLHLKFKYCIVPSTEMHGLHDSITPEINCTKVMSNLSNYSVTSSWIQLNILLLGATCRVLFHCVGSVTQQIFTSILSLLFQCHLVCR